jgi:DnaK suppressor protein
MDVAEPETPGGAIATESFGKLMTWGSIFSCRPSAADLGTCCAFGGISYRRGMATARERLLAERRRAEQRAAALEREFADLAQAASSAGTDDEHDPEGATLAFERQHAAALLDAARVQLAAIEAARQRLETGQYGICERCGQPIGDERLAARPAAVTCIRCAARSR